MDLERRLIDFTVSVIKLSKSLPNQYHFKQLSEQIARSSISVSLNYGEARCAESKKDFIHKLKVVLKELTETSMAVQIIKDLHQDVRIPSIIKENNELIYIFRKSIETAIKGRDNKK